MPLLYLAAELIQGGWFELSWGGLGLGQLGYTGKQGQMKHLSGSSGPFQERK